MILSIGQNKKKVLIKLLYFLIPAFIFLGTIFILWSLVSSQPFDHDESVYLTKARSWMEGAPADQFVIYRPIGMVSFGWIFLHFSDSEKVVRIFGVIFGALAILFIYLFFKRTFGVPVALGVTGVVGTSSLFLQQASRFFNDIPSSGFLIGVLYLFYIHYESAGRSKSIYFVGPLVALAFYIRYGVATTLGVIVVLSFFILLPKFRQKENVSYSKLQTTLIISILLFTPHFLESYIIMKDPLGLLSFFATGLLVHAEARYVFFSMVFLSSVGIASMYYLLRNRSVIVANLLMVIFLFVTFYFALIHYQNVNSFFNEREVNKTSIAYIEALKVIRKDSSSENGCALWLIPFRPTASWYSKCNILIVNDIDTFEKDIRIHFKKDLYSLVFTKFKEPQITQDESEKYGVILTEIFRVNKLSYGDLIVYRISRKNSDEEDYLNLLEK